MDDYKKTLVQVDEVLNYLPEEDLEKIPDEIKNIIKNEKDKDYSWKYDTSKKLKDQNINRDTIIFLSYLNMEYLLNDEQRELMNQIHEMNEKNVEKEKLEKYDSDNIFKNNIEKENIIQNSSQNEQEESNPNEALIESKESFFVKIINRIKSIFKK